MLIRTHRNVGSFYFVGDDIKAQMWRETHKNSQKEVRNYGKRKRKFRN